jgi:hypothetical protein
VFVFFHDPICNPTTSDLYHLLGLEFDIEQLQNVRFSCNLGLDYWGKELDDARADIVDQRIDDL